MGVGGGNVLSRHRSVVTARAYSGTPCPPLEEGRTMAAFGCVPHIAVGNWSGGSAACGDGWRYRAQEHTVCSGAAALRQVFSFTTSERCNVEACGNGELPGDHNVTVPAVPASSASLQFHGYELAAGGSMAPCHGDCDSDSDCGEGLKCHEQHEHIPIPGCQG